MRFKTKILLALIGLNLLAWSHSASAAQAVQYTVCRANDGHTITVRGYSCPIGYQFVRSFYNYE